MKKHLISYSVLGFIVLLLTFFVVQLYGDSKLKAGTIYGLNREIKAKDLEISDLITTRNNQNDEISGLKRDLKESFEKIKMAAAMSPLRGIVSEDEIVNLMNQVPHGNPFREQWTVTAPFGLSVGKNGESRTHHNGIDLIPRSPETDDWSITPIADGVVETYGENTIYGKYIVVRHSDNVRSTYCHLSKIYWSGTTGKKVTPQTVIARMGATGVVYSSFKKGGGAHLHFMLELQIGPDDRWVAIDPQPFLTNN